MIKHKYSNEAIALYLSATPSKISRCRNLSKKGELDNLFNNLLSINPKDIKSIRNCFYLCITNENVADLLWELYVNKYILKIPKERKKNETY